VAPEELLAVGRIARAHGVRGEVAVQPLSEVEARFAPGSVLRLGPDGVRPLTVEAARPHGHRLLVRFREVPDRTAAEELRGLFLLVPVSEAPDLGEDAWWPHQLVGCEVVTEEGRSFGPVTEVLHNPANDLWVTGHALVPAIRDVVVSVDLDARRIVVRDLPGLEMEG
jgi:16S rRNA processing protein RimM